MTETKQAGAGGANVSPFALPVHDATTTRRAGSLTPIDAVSECSDGHSLIGMLQIKLTTKLRSTAAKRQRTGKHREEWRKPRWSATGPERQFAANRKVSHLLRVCLPASQGVWVLLLIDVSGDPAICVWKVY